MMWWSIAIYLLVVSVGVILGQNVQVRLQDGLNRREGRVEVRYNDTSPWGTICDDNWDNFDAAVVCRMLNIVGESRAVDGGLYPEGSAQTPILLDSVDCGGQEQTLRDCQHNGWGVTDCDHPEDAGVICLGIEVTTTTTTTTVKPSTTTTAPPKICDTPDTSVRLDGGPNPAIGRVSILHEGEWGGVCDDRWGLQDAKVICRMLCYNPVNARAHIGTAYGNITGPIWLDDVTCDGDEETIQNCTSSEWGIHDCDATEAAGVSCVIDEPEPLPLPDPEVACEGDHITVSFLRSTEPRLEEDHLTLTAEGNTDCGYVTDTTTDYVIIKIPFVGCDTLKELNETNIMYSSTVRYDVPSEDPLIERSNVYYIPVHCVMGRNGDHHDPLEPEDRTVEPQYGNGKFDVAMYLYESNAFTTPVETFPVKVDIGAVVYVGVVLTSLDTDLKLVVPRCYATPDAEGEAEVLHYFIQDKCRADDSVVFYPINETMFGYRFTAFRFQNHTFVYLHCKGYVCDMAEKYEQCDRSCQPKDDLRKRRDVKDELRRRRDVSPAMSRRDVGPETFRADLAGAMYMMGGSDIDDQVNAITPKPVKTGSGAAMSTLSTTFFLLSALPLILNR